MYSDSPLKALVDRLVHKIRELKHKYSHDNSPAQKDALKLVEAFEALIINVSDLIAQRFDNQQTSTALDFLRPNSLATLGKLISPALTLKDLFFINQNEPPFKKINHPLLLELLMFLFFELRMAVPRSISELVPFANPDIPGQFISSKESFASLLNNPMVAKIANIFEMNQPITYELIELAPNTALRPFHLYISFKEDEPTSFHYKVRVSNIHIKYELALLPIAAQHRKNTIYLQSDEEHLIYEVIGSDGVLKRGMISWNSLPIELQQNFPKKQKELRDFQEQWLQTLLVYTAEAGHTCVIEDTINLQDIPNLEYNGCNLLKNPRSLNIKELNQLGLTRNTLILFNNKLHYFDLRKQKIHTIKSTNDNERLINRLKERFAEELRTANLDELELITSVTGVEHRQLLPLTLSCVSLINKKVAEITAARGHTHTSLSAIAESLMQIGIENLRSWYLFSTDAPQGCGLVRMDEDPSQLRFEEIEGRLNNRSTLILFGDNLFYADKVERSVQPIVYSNEQANFVHSITETYKLANTDDLKIIFKLTGKNHSVERIGTIHLSLDAANRLHYDVVDFMKLHKDSVPAVAFNRKIVVQGTIETLEQPLTAPLTMEQITHALQETILNVTHSREHTHEHSPYSYRMTYKDYATQFDAQEFYHLFLSIVQEEPLIEMILPPEVHHCIVKNPNVEFIQNETQRSQKLIEWMEQELAKLEREFPDPDFTQEPSNRDCGKAAERRLEEYKQSYTKSTFGILLYASKEELTLEDITHPDIKKPLCDLLAFRHIRMETRFAIVPQEEKDNYFRTLTQPEYILTKAKEYGFIQMTINPSSVPFGEIEHLLEQNNTIILFQNTLYHVDKLTKIVQLVQVAEDKHREFQALKPKFKQTYQSASTHELRLILTVIDYPNLRQRLYFADPSMSSLVEIPLDIKHLTELTDYVLTQFTGLSESDHTQEKPILSAKHQADITAIIDHAPGATFLVPILNRLTHCIERKLTLFKQYQDLADRKFYASAQSADQTFFLTAGQELVNPSGPTLISSCSYSPSADESPR